jgi:hypothetical protein
MKTPNQDKLEYWRNHLDKSKLYPEGIQAYCEANALAISAYYKWRRKILNLNSAKTISKKIRSPFSPVVVSSTEVKNQKFTQQSIGRVLPDGKWVAEIITNVIRGLL